MRCWFFLFIVLFSFHSKANIICVGNTSCKILNDVSEKNNLSLNMILNELNSSLIIPIINEQNFVSSVDLTRTSFSLKGVNENFRFGINIGTTYNEKNINFTILKQNFNNHYYFGGSKPTIYLEIPNNSQFNTIINITYWNGPLDYWINVVDKNVILNESSYSISERYFLLRNNYIDLSFISGFSFGNRNIVLEQSGSKFITKTQYGLIGWDGIENFKQNTYYIGIPNYAIGSIKLFNFILSGITQYNFVYTDSLYTITKFGQIGPFLTENMFLNVGTISENIIKKWNLIPEYGVSLEYEMFNFFINGFYQKSVNNINKFSIGIGGQF